MILASLWIAGSLYTFRRMMWFFWTEFDVVEYNRVDTTALIIAICLAALFSLMGIVTAPLMLTWSSIKYLNLKGISIPHWVFMSVPAHERKRIKQESQMAKIRQLEREKREKDHRIKQLEREVLNV